MKKLIPVFLLFVVLISGCTSQSDDTSTALPDGNIGSDNSGSGLSGQTISGKVIEITSSGFSPSSVKISAGDTIVFVNKDNKSHWPASDIHPTHGEYPEDGGCIGSKFDSCKGLSEGETYSFTFNEKGAWGFHDHINPGLRGTVVVE